MIVPPVGQTSDQYLLDILQAIRDVGNSDASDIEWQGGIRVGGDTESQSQLQEIIDALELRIPLMRSEKVQVANTETALPTTAEMGHGKENNEPAKMAEESPSEKVENFVFASDGDGYYLAAFGESGHFRRLKGLDIIARLIQTPSVPVAMVELVGAGDDDRLSGDQRSRQETLDEPARAAIRSQLTELRADYEKAKADNSTVEMDVAEKEIAELESRLLADIGIAGRSRDMNSEAEKLRPKIHGCLKTIYKTLLRHKATDERIGESL